MKGAVIRALVHGTLPAAIFISSVRLQPFLFLAQNDKKAEKVIFGNIISRAGGKAFLDMPRVIQTRQADITDAGEFLPNGFHRLEKVKPRHTAIRQNHVVLVCFQSGKELRLAADDGKMRSDTLVSGRLFNQKSVFQTILNV